MLASDVKEIKDGRYIATDGKVATKDLKNHLGERSFSTYEAWRRACKAIDPNVKFDGDKDICQAGNIGEWDGASGSIYTKDGGKD